MLFPFQWPFTRHFGISGSPSWHWITRGVISSRSSPLQELRLYPWSLAVFEALPFLSGAREVSAQRFNFYEARCHNPLTDWTGESLSSNQYNGMTEMTESLEHCSHGKWMTSGFVDGWNMINLRTCGWVAAQFALWILFVGALLADMKWYVLKGCTVQSMLQSQYGLQGRLRIRHLEPFDPQLLTDAVWYDPDINNYMATVFVRPLLVAGELKMHGMWRSLGFNWCYLWKILLKLNLPNYGFLHQGTKSKPEAFEPSKSEIVMTSMNDDSFPSRIPGKE